MSDEPTNDKINIFNTLGRRLNHILDNVGSKKGHGRLSEFHAFLQINLDKELKYSTVRAWFDKSSPPMKKLSQSLRY
jgi:hypothetical protein